MTEKLWAYQANLKDAHYCFKDIWQENDWFRDKLVQFEVDRCMRNKADEGKFVLLQKMAKHRQEIYSLKNDAKRGTSQAIQLEEKIGTHLQNLEEARDCFGSLQGEIAELRVRNSKLEEEKITLHEKFEQGGKQIELASSQSASKLKMVEATQAWKLYTCEIMGASEDI